MSTTPGPPRDDIPPNQPSNSEPPTAPQAAPVGPPPGPPPGDTTAAAPPAPQAPGPVDAPTADIGRDLGHHLRRDPALLLTLLPLFAAALGLWASYWYYRPFGIQIIDYMEIGDFLIGWLRDPTYIGLTLLAVLFGWALTWHDRFTRYHPERARALRDRWWGRLLFREDALRPRRFDPMGPVTGMLFGIAWGALVLVYWYDGIQVREIRAGHGERVQIVRAGHAAPDAQSPILLGVVNAWVFVYWPEQRRAEAIPQLSLAGLAYPGDEAPPPRAGATAAPASPAPAR